jgi:uncharacterized sulfatase
MRTFLTALNLISLTATTGNQRIDTMTFLLTTLRRLITCALLLPGIRGAAMPPNIVLIIADDQAWTDYSFMGHSHIRTPNLDRLANQSLTFTHGYVPTSLCCPSLASIITGLYPHQHKITSNDPPIPPGMGQREFMRSSAFATGREVMNQHLESVPTLPRLLAQKGYLSLETGKWWQGHFRRGGFTHGMTRGQRHGDEGLKIGRETMQPIHDFMAEATRQQKPFFIWYAPMMPHEPHTPPERLLVKYKDLTPSLPVAATGRWSSGSMKPSAPSSNVARKASNVFSWANSQAPR